MKANDTIYFVTGNPNKAREVGEITGRQFEQVKLDVPEIQHIDPYVVVEAKLRAAIELHEPLLLVEDTSFVCEALGKLPGPFIKWFEDDVSGIGDEGLYHLLENRPNKRARATVLLGLAPSKDELHFFEGAVSGTLVPPRGKNGFGFDVIFMPDGYDRTFAEMEPEEKNAISHRRLALDKMSEFLATR